MRNLLILAAALTIAALPVGVQAEQWLIVKDKEGKCSIYKTKAGTPTIVSGPYKSKDEARRAIKSSDCKKVDEKKSEEDKTEDKK